MSGTTRVEIAQHLDISTATLSRLIDAGVITTRHRSGIDLDVARIEYLRHLRWRASSMGSTELNAERTRLTRAQADKAEAELARFQSTRVPAEEVISRWHELVSGVREELSTLPGRLAVLAETAEDGLELEERLTNDVHNVLDRLAKR